MQVPESKYYRAIGTYDSQAAIPSLPKLKEITGFDAHDYIEPVSEGWGDILTLISDESGSENQLSSSLVILPYGPDIHVPYENSLETLVKKYGLKDIHFSEIFGRKKILKHQLQDFLEEYVAIVSCLPMSCLSISRKKSQLVEQLGGGKFSNEELFHQLFAENFSRLTTAFPARTIFHIYREKEQNLSPKMIDGEFKKLLSAIHMSNIVSGKPQSVCKHPHLFTKNALLFSSLTDLVAYTTNKIELKINAGIPLKKIDKEYGNLLFLIKSVYTNYSGLASETLKELIYHSKPS